MDQAKAAVSDFMSRAGKHDTRVDETVAPAVTHETVNRTRHENITGAVDREVHQHHYHTSIQPIMHREVLPEEHSHRVVPIEHREHRHDDEATVRARLEQERAQFVSQSREGTTTETHSEAPVIAGEHRHHHVHEIIQPIIHKETIQPYVIHTVVPVHEVHHNAAKHHAASTLPAMTMAEFMSQGGSLTGREARHDGFDGEPRAVAAATAGVGAGLHHHHHHNNRRSSGSDVVDSTAVDATGRHLHRDETLRSTGTGRSDYDDTVAGSVVDRKPTLKEKLNPRIDADGDGRAGVMD